MVPCTGALGRGFQVLTTVWGHRPGERGSPSPEVMAGGRRALRCGKEVKQEEGRDCPFPAVPEMVQGLVCQQHLLPHPAFQLLLGSKQKKTTTLSQAVRKKNVSSTCVYVAKILALKLPRGLEKFVHGVFIENENMESNLLPGNCPRRCFLVLSSHTLGLFPRVP